MKNEKISTGAIFYSDVNFNGESHSYEETKEVISLPESLNDKFLSVKVGELSQINAWRHYNDSEDGQIHQVWNADQADIGSIDGLSKFIITPKNSGIVAVRLINQSGIDDTFRAFVNTYSLKNPVDCYAGDDYEICGILQNKGTEYVTQISIFDFEGNVISNGSIYFVLEEDKVKVITYPETAPNHVSFSSDGGYRVTFTLNEIR
ncbi:beta/gamma crystallin domain-containing protein [Enterobacter sp. 22466]|uniref:beta/gamma crystallin domain-containing protein n=1 Tax=Enterobacter sp. 22466 TaxID=3453924 RepID=UPI003F847033